MSFFEEYERNRAMQQMTIEAMITVLQAFKEGKQIQVKRGGDWFDINEPEWVFSSLSYRIKPEPQHIWIIYRKGTSVLDSESIVCGIKQILNIGNLEQKHFVEVIE